MTFVSSTRAAAASLLFLVQIATAGALSAQDGGGRDALVLSTGSARGLAHAGALVGLERLGYDPDLVVGTSMGAVIGALYAAGYSAEQIWNLVLATSWGDLFTASPIVVGPERELSFPIVTLGLDLGSLEVSSGFIPDWRVNRLLTRLLFEPAARARSDFDRLPRRYRSVTADLADGSEVVLARGDLARAVRASMGTPAFFAAIPWDDRLLIDGGVANYLPVSVARELGATRVVAVDVSRAPDEVGRTDPASVAGRAISLLMRNALRDTVPPDVLVRPALDPDTPGAVFPDRPEFMLELGLEAALEADVTPSPTPGPRSSGATPTDLSGVEIEGPDGELGALARRSFGAAIGPYRPETVLRAVDHLYDTGLFNGVWPRVERRGPDSLDVLVVVLDANPRVSLNGAAGYDNDRGGRFWSTLDWRLAALGAPLEARAGVGNDGVELWFQGSLTLHAARMPGLTFDGGLHARRVSAPFFGGDAGDPEVHHSGGWIGARLRRSEIIVSVAGQAELLDVEDGPRGASWGGMLRISSTIAPTLVVGAPSEALARVRGGVLDYQVISGHRSFLAQAGRFQVAALIDGALALGDPPPDEIPSLGERRGMPGLQWGEERGRGRLLGGLDLATPLVGSAWGRIRLRGGAAADDVEDLDELDRWVAGVSVEGLWATPLGPVMLGYGVNTRETNRIDVAVGGVF